MNNRELIIKTMGMQDLPQEEQDKLIAQIEQIIKQNVENRLLSRLNAEEIQNLFDGNDVNDKEAFKKIKTLIPDYEEVLRQCAAETIATISV